MLTTERHAIILKKLNEVGSLTLQDIMTLIPVSESTVRRDLVELESAGDLVRVHGGVKLIDKRSTELAYTEKTIQNKQDKLKIAEIAAGFIQKGDCIYLDAGTSVIHLIPYLKYKDVVVVTNGVTHIAELMKHDITTHLIGGKVKARTHAIIGAQAIDALKMYRFDRCFLGANGYSIEYGFTTPDPEEANVKRVASSLAKKTYVLADRSKYEVVSFSKVIDLSEAVLITVNLAAEKLKMLQEVTTVKGMRT